VIATGQKDVGFTYFNKGIGPARRPAIYSARARFRAFLPAVAGQCMRPGGFPDQ
jgi:hypothetical protein